MPVPSSLYKTISISKEASVLMMKCDCEGCDKTREARLYDIPWGGNWITVSGAAHLHFCSLSCAIAYVRKQVGHE